MIQSLKGQPGFLLANQNVAMAEDGQGNKRLVFVDSDSGIQHHVPMNDENMNAIYAEWTGGKKVIVPSGAEIARVSGNGHVNGHG